MLRTAFLVCLFLPNALVAQDATPRAVVRDSVGTPVPFASVVANGTAARIASDSGIAFLRIPNADSIKLLVRRIGFAPVERWVRPDAAGDFHVIMRPLPQNLAHVSIFERNTPLSRTGFYDRLARLERGAFTARFITPEEIEMRNASRVSRLLEGENFVRVRSFSGKPVLSGRGGICAMGIVVDGLQMRGTAEEINAIDGEQEIQEIARRQRLDREAAERQFLAVRSSIDEIVSSLAVQAIEIYPSLSAAPPEIMRAASSMACGVVVISTGRP